MFKTFNVTLDLENKSFNESFQINTNDLNSVKIIFTITQDNYRFDLSGKTVKLAVGKPDKKYVYQDGVVTDAQNGKCEVLLSSQSYADAGKYDAELMIYEVADKIAVTGRFSYKVIGGILSDKSLQSTNEWPALDKAIEAGTKLIDVDFDLLVNASATFVSLQDQINQLKASGGTGGGDDMPLVTVKDAFPGTGNATKTYTDNMVGFAINNKGTSDLSFVINGITIVVEAGGAYDDLFDPFKTVSIIASGSYYAEVRGYISGTVVTQPSDTTAPTVSISPAAGTYSNSQSVTLTANETATIYYTLNGSTPTTSSSIYSGPITLNSTATIKCFAKDTAGNSSSVQSATFTINATDTTAPTVTISPTPGAFTSGQSVTLSANEASTIYYTLDGSTPTTSSTVYSGAISVSATTTIKYFAKDTAGNSSTVQTATYTINIADTTAPTVTASPVGGTFTSSQTVTLTANETATIYYTVDGTTPVYPVSGTTQTYSGPITLATTTTLKFIGRDTAGNVSTVQTQTYTINALNTAVVYPENGYLVMPFNQFTWIGAAAGYTDSEYIGIALQDNVLSPLFDQSTTTGDPIISTTYPFKPFITNMPTANYPYECSTIGTSGSYLGKMILKVSKTKGATATDLVTYFANSNEQMKVKLAAGYKTYTISSNITGVTTRTSGVDTVNYEYFKCTLSDGIGDYVPSTILNKFFASNGYEIITSGGYVYSYGQKAMRINADSTLEMLLPKGTLTSIDQAGVSSFLASANIKIYYI